MEKQKSYPSIRYHQAHGAVRVESAEHERKVANPDKGWKESPADLPAPDPAVCAHCGQKKKQ
jgi:hypothetical protein